MNQLTRSICEWALYDTFIRLHIELYDKNVNMNRNSLRYVEHIEEIVSQIFMSQLELCSESLVSFYRRIEPQIDWRYVAARYVNRIEA